MLAGERRRHRPGAGRSHRRRHQRRDRRRARRPGPDARAGGRPPAERHDRHDHRRADHRRHRHQARRVPPPDPRRRAAPRPTARGSSCSAGTTATSRRPQPRWPAWPTPRSATSCGRSPTAGARSGVTVHLVAPGPVESPRMQAIAERTAERAGRRDRRRGARPVPSGVAARSAHDDRRGRLGGRDAARTRGRSAPRLDAVARRRPSTRHRLSRPPSISSRSRLTLNRRSRCLHPCRRRRRVRRRCDTDCCARPPALFAEITESPLDRVRSQVHELPADVVRRRRRRRSPSRGCRRRSSPSTCSQGRPIEQHTAIIERMSALVGGDRRASRSSAPGCGSTRSRPTTGASAVCPRASCDVARSRHARPAAADRPPRPAADRGGTLSACSI